MSDQNFKNHTRLLPVHHFVAGPLILIALTCSSIHLVHRIIEGEEWHDSAIIFCISLALLLVWFYGRAFALKAQDRAIRAEENFRHYILTGKQLDSRLRMSQIVALRFASDGEFVALAKKAADENLGNKAIKQSIVNWKADNNRV